MSDDTDERYRVLSAAPKPPEADGVKLDGGKLRFDLIPPLAQQEMVRVLAFGARKYAENNWRKVPEARRRYFAAALRHTWAWWMGESTDAESGYHHLAHAMCCIAFALELELEKR